MGGYGSGRYCWSTTDKLNDHLKLKVKNILKSYQSGVLSWSCNGKKTAYIQYSYYLDNPDNMYVRLSYSVTPHIQLRHIIKKP